ncbi:MAG: hypothetical protein IV298_05200 [Cylindrospermopsis raciborskii KL1]|nr:hypothetical protein [Cylindrospermopsis raciborskii]MBG0742876.1 hypothetical protein [Cylindrospermopsis raciborskii KL1]
MEIKRNLNELRLGNTIISIHVSISYGDKEKFERRSLNGLQEPVQSI